MKGPQRGEKQELRTEAFQPREVASAQRYVADQPLLEIGVAQGVLRAAQDDGLRSNSKG